MKKLVLVESPTKARTIEHFLGKDYAVRSSYGHIRDLPSGKLGIDIENNFEPQYVIPTKARKNVNQLKKEAQEAEEIILATDEDREGEAIAWHLAQALGLGNFQIPNSNSKTNSNSQIPNTQAGQTKPYHRIVFHEITKEAIQEALSHPRTIDVHRVNAQQARRVLDRLVGYKLSPFLWKKVTRGLSAGRVQSAALRLIVDREREIEQFKPEEYWSIVAALLKTANPKSQILNSKIPNEFEAQLAKKDGKTIGKLDITNKEEADRILHELEGAEYQVASVQTKETKRNPLPPFTTSTLQQAVWQRLHYSARQTMQLAQQLYETGHITYHRTDSLNLSSFSQNAAQKFITEAYGAAYHPGSPRTFKTKSKGAQEAHEAIRPSYPDRTPESLKQKLTPQQHKLYQLIWQRFIASQMTPAIFDSLSVEINAGAYTFRANGQTLKFDGFLKVYPIQFEEKDLPPLEQGERLALNELKPEQHFTQPPPRYTEASLIKVLEELGIGRPSTYAPTLSTIQERNYVEKNDQKRFAPTELGITVSDLLVEHFPRIVDTGFTAQMEEDLDRVAEGEKEWVPLIKEFYDPFAKLLEQKYEEVSKETIAHEQTDRTCPNCGRQLIIRLGRYGKFYACPGFPECKYTDSLQENKPEALDIACPKCSQGNLTPKYTKRRKIFYGCNRYPDCDFALWDKPTGERCSKCDSLLIQHGKQIKCSNPECEDGVKKRSRKR